MHDKNKTKDQLLEELARLRRRVVELESGAAPIPDHGEAPGKMGAGSEGPRTLRTVRIPEQFREVFLKAEDYVKRYFDRLVLNPEQGTIEISGERYILVRAASMSTEFFDLVASLYRDRGTEEAHKVAKGFLFDIAHALGKADAREFHAKMDVTNPIDKLSAGPIHFAYAGWAFVDISPQSRPSPDKDYVLVYDHPFAFEADAWLKAGRETDFPVCIMNAGYSSGWCEESFGISLVAVEVACRAMGDDHCRFVMAPPSRIEQYVAQYAPRSGFTTHRPVVPDVPEFFQRKRLEDALQKSYGELEERVERRTSELRSANERLENEIEERKAARKALEAEKERLAVTLRSIGDGVIATDTEGMITLMNSVAGELTGWSPKDAVGRPLDSVFHVISDQTGERLHAPFGEVIGRSETIALPARATLVSKAGSTRTIADSGAPIHDGHGKIIGMVLVFRDITDRLKTEAELLKGHKLESLGILAGGIAHDFNNILQAVLGNVSLAKAHSDQSGSAYTFLNRAEKAAAQATGLTQQLLTFSKGGAPIKETTSITELLKDSTEFALRGTNVAFQIHAPNDIRPVDLDRAQMSQVMANLIINAIQAMPHGGTIHVFAANKIVQREEGLPLKPGDYVRVSVKDEGIGIPPDILPKVFDPYFTTKKKGSGLGLSVSYSIVRNHGGHITVDSEIGKGTTFSIYLPASGKPVRPKALPGDEATARGERILVMDDDETVRETVRDLLSELGFRPTLTSDGEEAIREFRRAADENEPFHAIIMDLTVHGGMGGLEATRRIKEIDPSIRAVVASGYTTDPVLAAHEEHGFHGVLVKPFRIDQLSDTLRGVLRG